MLGLLNTAAQRALPLRAGWVTSGTWANPGKSGQVLLGPDEV